MQHATGQQFADPNLFVYGHLVVEQVQFGQGVQMTQRRRKMADDVRPQEQALQTCEGVNVLGNARDHVVGQVQFAQCFESKDAQRNFGEPVAPDAQPFK